MKNKPKYRIIKAPKNLSLYQVQRRTIFGWRNIKLKIFEFNSIVGAYYVQKKDSPACSSIEEAERDLSLYRDFPKHYKCHKIVAGLYRYEPFFVDTCEVTYHPFYNHDFYKIIGMSYEFVTAAIDDLLKEREVKRKRRKPEVVKEYF